MAGLINTGLGYQSQAIRGLSRTSADQKRIEQANEQMEAAEKQQKMSMTASGAATGAMAGAAMGASYGSYAGWYGAAAGAVLGFLFSDLF